MSDFLKAAKDRMKQDFDLYEDDIFHVLLALQLMQRTCSMVPAEKPGEVDKTSRVILEDTVVFTSRVLGSRGDYAVHDCLQALRDTGLAVRANGAGAEELVDKVLQGIDKYALRPEQERETFLKAVKA